MSRLMAVTRGLALCAALLAGNAMAAETDATSPLPAPTEFAALPAAQQQQLQKFATQWPALTESQRQRILAICCQ